MKKLLTFILLLVSINCISQSTTCVDYYKDHLQEINSESESDKKSFFDVYFSCLSRWSNSSRDSLAYQAFLRACIYERTSYQQGVKSYLSSIKNHVNLDTITKKYALYCFVNSGAYVANNSTKNISENQSASINLFLNLFDEIIKQDSSFICLRMTFYRKMLNCFDNVNKDEFNKYKLLYETDKVNCNCCYEIKDDNFYIVDVKKKIK